jgi:predicted  nucleic acid-binding Zn-ribbon protein
VWFLSSQQEKTRRGAGLRIAIAPAVMDSESSNHGHPLPHYPGFLVSLIQSPRKLGAAVVSVLLLWTALLGVAAHLGGVGVAAPEASTARRLPGGAARRRLLHGAPGTADDDELDNRWANKLISDLQSSAADESVSATLSELRSTLAARDERRDVGARRTDAPVQSSTGAVKRSGEAAATASTSIAVPRYNAGSVAELQKAALAAAMPDQVKGALPQLVRDMSATITKQQQDKDALQKRLSQLKPAVINYNPKDVDQLTKAISEATASQGAEVSGALPKLLKDLGTALKTQQDDQKALEKRLQAVAGRKARSTRRAKTLRDLILRAAPKIEDKVSILFGELTDRCERSMEEARGGAELDNLSESDGGEDGGKWQESLQQLQETVMEEVSDPVPLQSETSPTAAALRSNQTHLLCVPPPRCSSVPRPSGMRR